MKFEDLGGSVEVNPLAASYLLRTLYDPDEVIALTGMRAVRNQRNNLLTSRFRVRDLVTSLESSSGRDTLYQLCTSSDLGPERMNMYFGLTPLNKDTTENMHMRIKDADAKCVSVLYADLDVKAGSFSSTEEILDFLWGLEFIPNVVVTSGSGGIHAYWRLEKTTPVLGRSFLDRWWAYLSHAAEGRKIDRLVDLTRMSRLPGSVRWPKENESIGARVVGMLRAEREGVLRGADVMALSAAGWAVVQKKRERSWESEKGLLAALEGSVRSAVGAAGGGRWGDLLLASSVEEWVSERVSWDSILGAVGWTFLREDSEGRREWQRPGGQGKSATVDWPESPNVMSLLSSSEGTGLSDLLDAGVVLTKWRVMLRVNFGDSIENAVKWVVDQMKGKEDYEVQGN